MTSFPANIALITDSVEKLFGYGTIVFDDIFALSKSAASKAIGGSEVSGLVKPAVSKAAGVVVDDMTVVSGGLNESEISQNRETVVWYKIVAGSFVNKAIVSTIILVAGVTFPIIPEMMLSVGACYLAFEGAHKVLGGVEHIKGKLVPSSKHIPNAHQEKQTEASASGFSTQLMNSSSSRKIFAPLIAAVDLFLGTHPKERAVLKDLLILDGILSTEILLMANSTLTNVPLGIQIIILAIVSVVITFGVYGIVYAIIRADNVAESLRDPNNTLYYPTAANSILRALPYTLMAISLIGTVAMLGVAGEVASHILPALLKGSGLTGESDSLASTLHDYDEAFISILPMGGKLLASCLIGLLAGTVLILILFVARKMMLCFSQIAPLQPKK